MNIGRIGHYHIPKPDSDGACQAALVVYVWNDDLVNLITFDHDGDISTHTSVPVEHAPATETTTGKAGTDSSAAFHLGPECPFNR